MTGDERLRIVEYKPEHLQNLKLRSEQESERPPMISGEAYTFLFDDMPVAIIGWRLLSAGILQVWTLLADRVECPIRLHRAIGHMIDHGFDVLALRRMQMSVRCGFAAGWNWASALGFSCEGVMQNYGPDGHPYWLFARVA
jgi:hypothetical protein